MTTTIPSATHITELHDQSIVHWKETGIIKQQTNFYALVEENHSWNFQLWLAEDRARRDDKGFEFVYHAKREIDHHNQQRNNMMEKMDAWLYNILKPSNDPHCAIHSETPGMIIDRLSILALKIYHMQLQALRQDVELEHQQTCQNKTNTLKAQREQLSQCLSLLFSEINKHQRTFKIYHQFKMYNDPTLNPELYKS